ncbi:MAG: hypothetical protein AAFY41_14435, partial [Bacteroidota bacterium]
MKRSLITACCLLLFFAFSKEANAQIDCLVCPPPIDCLVCEDPIIDPDLNLSGTTSVNLNSTYTYTVSISGGNHESSSYTVSGGQIISQSKTSVRVKWTSLGSRWVKVTARVDGNYFNKTRSVTVTTTLSPGTIVASGPTSICPGSSIGRINNVQSASGGNGSLSYQWQAFGEGPSNPSEITPIGGGSSMAWYNINGARSSSFTPDVYFILSATKIRRKVTSAGQTAYSNEITFSPATVSAGSISYSGGNINANVVPARVNGTNASGSNV